MTKSHPLPAYGSNSPPPPPPTPPPTSRLTPAGGAGIALLPLPAFPVTSPLPSDKRVILAVKTPSQEGTVAAGSGMSTHTVHDIRRGRAAKIGISATIMMLSRRGESERGKGEKGRRRQRVVRGLVQAGGGWRRGGRKVLVRGLFPDYYYCCGIHRQTYTWTMKRRRDTPCLPLSSSGSNVSTRWAPYTWRPAFFSRRHHAQRNAAHRDQLSRWGTPQPIYTPQNTTAIFIAKLLQQAKPFSGRCARTRHESPLPALSCTPIVVHLKKKRSQQYKPQPFCTRCSATPADSFSK